MLEACFKKEIPGRKMLQRVTVIPAGVWIAAVVVALVGGRTWWKAVQRPDNLAALAEESGNLSFMLENEKPRLNHAGTRLLFCHSSENGVGVFVCNTASGVKKMLFEEKEIHFGLGPHGVLSPFPWSPDDRWFVYTHQGPGAVNQEQALPEETALTICQDSTDEAVQTLIAPFGRVVALEWLDAKSFVYVGGTEAHDIMLVKQQPDGVWMQSRLNTPDTGRAKMSNRFCSLGILSTNTIIWLQANSLWTMNVDVGDARRIVAFSTNQIFTSFDYSPQTKQFLLSCAASKADSLWQMPLDDPNSLTQIVTDIPTHDDSWNDAVWIENGNGYAFSRRPGLQPFGLMIKTSQTAKPTLLFKQSYIQYFTVAPGGTQLFVVGDIDKQGGSAIWKYDLSTGDQRCIVSGSETPPKHLKHLKHLPLRYANIQVPSKARLNVVVFSPPNEGLSSTKKYPLVIASIRFVEEDPYLYQYPEAIANAGAYVAVIDHPWSFRNLSSWAYYVNGIREHLSQFASVDPKRIYAMSISAQAGGLINVLTNAPGAWRGTLSLSPPVSSMPKATEVAVHNLPLKSLITIEAGMGDTRRLKQYQGESCAAGMPVEFLVHPEAPHAFIAKKSQRARIRAMLHFLFDE